MRRSLSVICAVLFLVSIFNGCKDNSDLGVERQYSDLQVEKQEGELKAGKQADLKGDAGDRDMELGERVGLYYFYGSGCPNCERVKTIIERLTKNRKIVVKKYEVWYNKKNRSLLLRMAKDRNLNVKGVPAVIIENDLYVGVKEISGIQDRIDKYYK